MKKLLHYQGQKVKVIKTLMVPQPNVNGRAVPSKPLVDKDGEWVQVELENGCRIPAPRNNLI